MNAHLAKTRVINAMIKAADRKDKSPTEST